MAGRGGYQPPANPAPASGPGSLARRTDGGPGQPIRVPTGGSYGSATELAALQQAAPLAATPGGDAPPAGGGMPPITPMGAPTQRPDEPVTAGAPLGPGPGMDALGLTSGITQDDAKLMMYLPVLEAVANRPGATHAMRNLVRDLKGKAALGS